MPSLSEVLFAMYANLERGVDGSGAMHARVPPTCQGLASMSNPSDVTSLTFDAPTPSTSPTSELVFEDILDDPEYDQISDRAEVVEEEAFWRDDPSAVRRRAMAEDFSEGKLETVVDSPQRENAGTQTQYVSYQITTKVGVHVYSYI
jgi:sorting nexin-4